MLPTTPNGVPIPTHPEPELTDRTPSPKGVLQKNLKMGVYIGAVLVLVLAMFVSSAKKTTATTAAKPKDATAAPVVQDNTANNVQALRAQLDMEKQRQQQAQQDAALQSATVPFGTPAQQAAAASFGANGQAAPPQAYAARYVPPAQNGSGSAQAPQLTPAAAAGSAACGQRAGTPVRFALRVQSGLQPSGAAAISAGNCSGAAAEPVYGETQPGQPSKPHRRTYRRRVPQQANSPAATTELQTRGRGQCRAPRAASLTSSIEGMTLDTVLMNRLDGDAAGPVKVLVSNPVYSHDHQHVLIPEGTIVLGEAKKIGGSGFGQQRRMAVVFHRMIMPDGYSADLDQFHGLDQIGEGRTKRQGEQPLPADLRDFHRAGRHLRSGSDHRRRQLDQFDRIAGIRQWRCSRHFATGDHRTR